MSTEWEFGRALVRHALSRTYWVLGLAGAVVGTTAYGLWQDIVNWSLLTVIGAVAIYLLLFVLVGGYGAWSEIRAKVDRLQASLEEQCKPIVIGGSGGTGGSADGSVGDVIITGNGGGGGGAAFGPGSFAAGGEGGKTAGPTPF